MRTHGPGRGTRYTQGALSGVTFVTTPSGVTIDQQGIDTGYGTPLRWTCGIADNANNEASAAQVETSVNHRLYIDTGLNTVSAFVGSLISGDGTGSGCTLRFSAGGALTTPAWSYEISSATAGGVTVYSFVVAQAAGTTPGLIFSHGVSLQWIAFGT